ncbi:MAG TPA: hypothetical protein VHG72_05795 [Polyangia bacterium]|nr:hypothetical protein [Polyangia bacterium]
MAKKHHKHQAGSWKGEAVEERPSDEAEQAADRAEGNSTVRADAESERLRTPRLDEQATERHHGESRTGDPDLDTAEVAAEHRARTAGERPPRGKL